jgi:hypothetical protein
LGFPLCRREHNENTNSIFGSVGLWRIGVVGVRRPGMLDSGRNRGACMLRSLLFVMAVSTAFAAEDPWAKVKELKSGTEIRIVKKGSAQPLVGKFDELREDSVVVVIKNEQTAVHKEDIDRLDARPNKPASRSTETKVKTEAPDAKPPAGMGHGAAVPGTSYSTNTSFGSKPEFETVYRRSSPAPKK